MSNKNKKSLSERIALKSSLAKSTLAEFVATFVLIVLGCGSVAQAVLSRGLAGNFITVNIGFAMAVTMAVYIAGGVSGGHVNPAVTLAMCATGRLDWCKFPFYVCAQMLGAMAGAAAVFGIYYDAFMAFADGMLEVSGPNATAHIFATYPSPFLSITNGFAEQVTSTALLVLAVFAILDSKNIGVPKGLEPVAIGLLILLLVCSLSLNSGCAMNPARDLGPRMFTAVAGWGLEVFTFSTMAFTLNSKSSEGLSCNQTLAIQAEIQKLSIAGSQYFSEDDISLALSRFKKAYLLSCRLPEKNIQKVCLFNLGAAYISVEKPKKGLKCLLKSMTKGNEGRDGDLYFNIAAAYDVLKDHQKAVKFYEQAINTYGVNELNNISDALIKLGYCFVAMGNFRSAVHSFRLASGSYEKAQKHEDAAMAMREAASYMIKSQTYSRMEVIQTLNAGVKICDRVTDKSLLGKLYNHLGLHYAEIKCFKEAGKCFTESMHHCSGTNFSIQKMAVLQQNTGAVDNAIGQYETSLTSHAEAADMFDILGDRNAQGQCLCNLAYAYSQMENYDKAGYYYQHALKAFVDAGELSGQWQACEGLGATHFCQGNTDQAIAYYKQALSLFGKSKETSDVSRERILRKLTDAIEYRATSQHPESLCSESNPSDDHRSTPSPHEHEEPLQTPPEAKPEAVDQEMQMVKSKVCSIL